MMPRAESIFVGVCAGAGALAAAILMAARLGGHGDLAPRAAEVRVVREEAQAVRAEAQAVLARAVLAQRAARRAVEHNRRLIAECARRGRGRK